MSDTFVKVVLGAQDNLSKVLNGLVGNFKQASKSATDASTVMSRGLSDASKAAGLYVDANGRMRDAQHRFAVAVVEDSGKVVQASQAAAKGVSDGLSEAAKAAGHYVDASGRVRDAHGRYVAGVTSGNDKVRNSTNGLPGSVGAAMHKVGQAFVSAGNVAMTAANKVAHAVGAIVAAAGRAALAVGSFALIAGVASIKLATGFEATMNDFKMAAGDNLGAAGLSADDFTKKFLQLGKDTKYSSQEAAAAGVELVKGGVDIKTVMGDATTATLNLAAAAKSELAPTARIVAQQLGVWADAGATATETADLMAQALNASTLTTLDDLALGLANVNGVAKASGASQKDVIIAMAGTSKAFASASDQGTSFKTMLQMMAGPSADAKGAMRELGLMTFDYAKANTYLANVGIKTDGSVRGINSALDALTKKMKLSKKDATAFYASFEQNQFYDAEGKFKGMRNAADILQKSLAGLSDQAKTEALGDIFGQDGIRMAFELAQMGAEGFDGMAEAMKKQGTAAEMAAKLNKGFGFILESVKGSIESIGIAFGLKLLPYLTSFTETYILPMVNGFGDWIDTIDLTNVGLGTLYNALENVFGTAATEVIMDVVVAFQTLITTLSSGGDMTAFSNSLKGLTTTGVGEVLGNIALAAQSVYTAIATNWPMISATATAVFTSIGVIFNAVLLPQLTWIVDQFSYVVSWVSDNWPLIVKTFQDSLPFWKATLGVLVITFVTTWEMIKASISNVITLILAVMKAGMQLMQGDTQGALNTMYEAFKRIFNNILEAVKVPINLVVTFLGAKFSEIQADLAGRAKLFYELGKNIVLGLLQSFIDFGDRIKTKLIEMIMGPLGYVKELLGIHSPSDEMMWVGEMIGTGLAMGIENSIDLVKESMKKMHEALFTAPAIAEPQGTAQVNWSGNSYNNGNAGGNNITTINLGGVTVNDRGDANHLLRTIGNGLLMR